MMPTWLHLVSGTSLALGLVTASVIAVHELRHPQKMWIMNIVWPLVALFGTIVALWAYFRFGTLSARDHSQTRVLPFPVMVGKAAAHCGSGCCLGDICAEWLCFAVPGIAVAFGWKALFDQKMFAVWILDFLFAFGFGIVFQYFTIQPMRDLSVGRGLKAALKADTLSLLAWQVGMYGYMAIAHFLFFGELLHRRLEVDSVEFWFMMQIAMLAGFATSYPVNWWLLRRGFKEMM